MKNTALFLLTLSLGACGNDLGSPAELDQPRVLAIQAQPPQPAMGSGTTLRPLVYLPGGESAAYAWSWCPIPTSTSDAFVCHIDQAGADSLFAQLGVHDAPRLDLGSGDTARFTNPFSSTVVATLCSSGSGVSPPLLFACTSAGLPVTVNLTVHTSHGDWSAITYVYLPADDTLPPNQNPIADGLLAGDPGQTLDETGSLRLPRQSHVPIQVVMAESVAEPLPNPGPGDKPFERITLSWYAEGGSFGDQGRGGPRTGYLGDPADPNATFDSALANTWNTPDAVEHPDPISRVIVVIRDSRGGVSWVGGVVTLQASP